MCSCVSEKKIDKVCARSVDFPDLNNIKDDYNSIDKRQNVGIFIMQKGKE